MLAIGEASEVLRKHHVVNSRAKSIQGSHRDVLSNCEELTVKSSLNRVTLWRQSCPRVVQFKIVDLRVQVALICCAKFESDDSCGLIQS